MGTNGTAADLWVWTRLSAHDRNSLAREAWCSVGAQQGYCSGCGVGFRGLAPFDRGFSADREGCDHLGLIGEGKLTILEWREVDGVMCPRAGDPDTRDLSDR